MKVGELRAALEKMPQDIDVVFDTEAARFMQHYVEVDGCDFDAEWEQTTGMKPKVVLSSRVGRDY